MTSDTRLYLYLVNRGQSSQIALNSGESLDAMRARDGENNTATLLVYRVILRNARDIPTPKMPEVRGLSYTNHTPTRNAVLYASTNC